MDGYLRETPMTQVMLNRKNKNIYLLLLSLLFFCFSCSKQKNETLEKTKLYKSFSNKLVRSSVYSNVYIASNDSLKSWIENKLSSHKQESCNTWKIDSLLCFNQEGTKCVMSLLIQQKEGLVSNAIDFFYGVKIQDSWYFFNGATCYPTPYNDKGILSFAQLHEIAMKEVFNGYLIKKKKDTGWWKNIFDPEYEYEINERWFDYHFKGSGWGCGYMGEKGWIDTCSEEEFEQLYYKKALSNWERK